MNSQYSYYNPVETHFGQNVIRQIVQITKKFAENRNVLIVSDENLLQILDIKEIIYGEFISESFEVSFFEKPGIYSSIALIDEASIDVRKNQYGVIIGIGGGSAMDTAKCLAILGKNDGSINEYLKKGKQLQHWGIPYIAIPTTAGTGSEVTKWATVWDLVEPMKKYSLADDKMYAKAALIDPTLLIKLPKSMTASTGLDALSQAIEAYWSKNHNQISDLFALKAIELISQNLLSSYQHPEDVHLREQMARGKSSLGLAFSNTKTTAVHSVSYPMTLHYNISHGHACALTLGEFLIFNAEVHYNNENYAPERIKQILHIFGFSKPEEFRDWLQDIMQKMNLETRLTKCGVPKDGIKTIIDEGFTPDRVKHNPRLVTEDDLRAILTRIF